MVNKQGRMALAAVFMTVHMGSASAQDVPTIDGHGRAQCGMGDNAASAGRKPTAFANQYWSHLGCGLFDQANDVLNKAPKAGADEPLPKVEDMFKDTIADCYYKSFAYDFTYHERSVEPDGSKVVIHGWYTFTDEKFQTIERATLEACKPKLS